MKATDKPLIIINESMQFSAGVNLNYVMDFVKKGDLKSVEKFIKYFQQTCKHLKYVIIQSYQLLQDCSRWWI